MLVACWLVQQLVPMMEGRLAYIKADLEIADAQMAAWDAYANAVRARHATMEGIRAEMMKAKAKPASILRAQCGGGGDRGA
jgi:LTXXQ motif family protein